MQIFDCEQYSPEWWACRLGLPTASMFGAVLAKGKGGAESKTRRTYMLKLAGERLTSEPADAYTNSHMDRGKEMEPEARALYAMMTDAEPRQVGFIRNGKAGCSPDSLIGEDGILEIKTALPHILIGYWLADIFPAEHVAQCQGQLWVTGRKWVDIAIYWPKLPLFVKRAERDEDYIAKLANAVADFDGEVAAIVERIGKAV